MDRMYEIDEFLKYFAAVYSRNPDKRISSDSFYYRLTLFGLTPQEIEKKNMSKVNPMIRDDFFKRWEDYFKDNPNLNVYWTSVQGRFLQFNNSKNNDSECYKLYLSFPEDKMYECVKLVFKYIADNNMETFSKVADCVRSDSVILRMAKKSDAIKLMNFINNTPQISQYCKPTNPFLPRNGKVGIAYDRWMSFNNTLSFMLEKYFMHKRATSTLNLVSVADFRQYVAKFYQDISFNKEALTALVAENEFADEVSRLNWMSSAEVYSNMKDIIEYIAVCLNPNLSIDDYYHKIDTFMDPKHNRENCEIFRDISRRNPDVDDAQYNAEDFQLATQIIDAYIVYALNKYSTVSAVCQYLEKYLDGNTLAITRDKDFRYKFATRVSSEMLYRVVDGDLENYVTNIRNSIRREQQADNEYYRIFDMACNATLNKYDLEQLMTALLMGINGNYGYFTNAGSLMLRDKIKKIPPELFRKYANQRLKELRNQLGNQQHRER